MHYRNLSRRLDRERQRKRETEEKVHSYSKKINKIQQIHRVPKFRLYFCTNDTHWFVQRWQLSNAVFIFFYFFIIIIVSSFSISCPYISCMQAYVRCGCMTYTFMVSMDFKLMNCAGKKCEEKTLCNNSQCMRSAQYIFTYQ